MVESPANNRARHYFPTRRSSDLDLVENAQSLGFDLRRLSARRRLLLDYVQLERDKLTESGEYDLEGLYSPLSVSLSRDRKSTRLNSSHRCISYAVFCLKKKKVIEWNPAAEKTFGYRRAEVLGREMGDLIIPRSLRGKHRQGLARFLSTGEALVLGKRVEMTAMHADGREFPVELAITRIQSDGPPMFTGYVREISERKRAEATRNQLAAIVESSGDAIIGETLEGTILSWNAAAVRIFGYSAEE